MNYKTHRLVLQVVVIILIAAAVLTAAFDLILVGFTPVVWFMLAIWVVLLIICNEVTRIREKLESGK